MTAFRAVLFVVALIFVILGSDLVDIVARLLVVVAPVSLAASVYLWELHREDRLADRRVPLPRLRLSLVLALMSTIATLVSFYLGTLALMRISGIPTNFREISLALTPITLLAFVALDLISLLAALYLRWLRGQGSAEV